MHRLISIIVLFLSLSVVAQDGILVKSFRCLPQDMEARVNNPVIG
ncbi:MAG: hypothetical protein PF590_07855 [Candidatus Delongbacteria bacterium]|jgi:hypothetical protein|nr:hypothetical protein [Candidatus Delongbacteria bacterium]